MYAKNFSQHLGPVLNFNYLIKIRNWVAIPYVGYHTQLGIMGRRVQYFNQISTGGWTSFEEDSPLYRWENQIIVGSYLPIKENLRLKIYGGIGMAGLFNIDPRAFVLDYDPLNNKTREFGSQFGLGLSYQFK